MPKKLTIDYMDRRIVHLLAGNPNISQSDLAERLGISQPAISSRLIKLRKNGVEFQIGVNIGKTHKILLAKIDLVTSKVEDIINLISNCPMFVTCFLTTGKSNLTIFLKGEQLQSLMSWVNCVLRLNPAIKEMEFSVATAPNNRDCIIPISPILDKKQTTPCGKDCTKCVFYNSGNCLGCPASIYYKGNLL